jgi:hypothetical protein
LSDIFREVEEEVRRERFEQLWKQYGDYVIAAVALVIIAIAGYELWQRYEQNQRFKASETLIAAQDLAESGDFSRANPALATIVRDAPHGYAEMARLSEAGALVRAGQHAEAVQIYKSIAADDRGPLGNVALIRAGWAGVDDMPRADLETLLAPLTDPTSPWRHAAAEVLAFADYRAGATQAALKEFQALADDKDATDTTRRRAAAMAALLKEGGMRNFGSVPLPPAPPAPGAAPPNGTPQP